MIPFRSLFTAGRVAFRMVGRKRNWCGYTDITSAANTARALPEAARLTQAELYRIFSKLDIPIQTRWEEETPRGRRQGFLTVAEMRKLYDRRRTHMCASGVSLEWAEGRGSVEESRLAVAFWHGGELLPDVAVDGLRSAARVGKLDVVLATYNNFDNIPAEVSVADAGEFMPRSDYEAALAKGWKVTDLSNYIRCKMIQSRQRDALLLDCDTLFLRPAQVPNKDRLYHMFASMRANKSPFNKPSRKRHFYTEFLREQDDFLYLATPWYLPHNSPLLVEYTGWYESVISHPFPGDYLIGMKQMNDLVRLSLSLSLFFVLIVCNSCKRSAFPAGPSTGTTAKPPTAISATTTATKELRRLFSVFSLLRSPSGVAPPPTVSEACVLRSAVLKQKTTDRKTSDRKHSTNKYNKRKSNADFRFISDAMWNSTKQQKTSVVVVVVGGGGVVIVAVFGNKFDFAYFLCIFIKF